MKTDLQALLGMGLLVSVINVLPAPAQADEVIWRNTETSVAPNVYVASPSSMTTTTKIETAPSTVIETTPTSSILLAPAYMGAQPMADETISRRTVIEGTRPAASSSETAIVSSSLDNKPNYGERIRLMREQLNKGTANGWITGDRSAALSSRLNELQDTECTVRKAGFLKTDCDSFEKELTGFNIELSHSMENHSL
jgi:hypothetical protein